MKRLIIHGDPGVRKDAVIEYDGDERTLFQVTRNGDWSGPERVQLWCVMGEEEERSDFEERNFVPQWLDVETADADEIEVKKKGGDLVV